MRESSYLDLAQDKSVDEVEQNSRFMPSRVAVLDALVVVLDEDIHVKGHPISALNLCYCELVHSLSPYWKVVHNDTSLLEEVDWGELLEV